MMVGAMLGGFLIKNKFSNRSQLSEQFTRGKFNLFLFFGWLSLQRYFAVSAGIYY